MGRSVATPYDSEWSVYLPFEYDDPDDAEWEWDDFKSFLTEELKEAFPALDPEDKWLERECHGFLSNGFGTFYLSEYCGLVSLSFVLDDLSAFYSEERDRTGLGTHWAANAYEKVKKVMAGRLYYKAATFSNGEGVYERYAA
jgi:hypothetical protein